MMAGVGAIALSSATGQEQLAWKAAAHRESRRYGVATDYIDSRMDGRQSQGEVTPSRSVLDWFLVAGATAIFIFFAAVARVPEISFRLAPAAVLSAALLVLLIVCGLALWRTTRFQ